MKVQEIRTSQRWNAKSKTLEARSVAFTRTVRLNYARPQILRSYLLGRPFTHKLTKDAPMPPIILAAC